MRGGVGREGRGREGDGHAADGEVVAEPHARRVAEGLREGVLAAGVYDDAGAEGVDEGEEEGGVGVDEEAECLGGPRRRRLVGKVGPVVEREAMPVDRVPPHAPVLQPPPLLAPVHGRRRVGDPAHVAGAPIEGAVHDDVVEVVEELIGVVPVDEDVEKVLVGPAEHLVRLRHVLKKGSI